MLANHDDAMREYARNVGWYDRFQNHAWILTDYDVWVKNPHYTGPAEPHPESYDGENATEYSENYSVMDDIPY